MGLAGAQLCGAGGKSRQGPRLNDLAVQSSAYGTPLPRLYGMIRASGSVLWAPDIRDTAHRFGWGKGKPKPPTYSYAASLAEALSASPLRSVKRFCIGSAWRRERGCEILCREWGGCTCKKK